MLSETLVTALPAGITASGEAGEVGSAGPDMTPRMSRAGVGTITSDPTALCKHAQLRV